MPVRESQSAFWTLDVRRWEACRAQARADMLIAGWSEHARKFRETQFRKARKLFFAKRHHA